MARSGKSRWVEKISVFNLEKELQGTILVRVLGGWVFGGFLVMQLGTSQAWMSAQPSKTRTKSWVGGSVWGFLGLDICWE